MENNEPPQPPPQPPPPPPFPPWIPQNTLVLYNYNNPYDTSLNLLLTKIRKPFNVILYNFNINNTRLDFTITNNSITITPYRAVPKHNNVADDDGDGDGDDDNEGDNNNDAGLQVITFPNRNGIREYGIRLPTLPTLPSYINIAYNNLVLLINSGPSIHFISPALPLPINQYNINNHGIYQSIIVLPFSLRFLFNDPITNTVITVFIRVSGTDIDIRASTQTGFTDYAAYVSIIDPRP